MGHFGLPKLLLNVLACCFTRRAAHATVYCLLCERRRTTFSVVLSFGPCLILLTLQYCRSIPCDTTSSCLLCYTGPVHCMFRPQSFDSYTNHCMQTSSCLVYCFIILNKMANKGMLYVICKAGFFSCLLFLCHCSLIHSFVHSFIRSFVHSFIRSFVHSFIRSFVHLFIRSFVHSFIRSFVRHSFVYFID
jgi:hypothetical protein